MSEVSVQRIKCPKCGAESDYEMWQSVNTEINPEMKAKVRSGEIFTHMCEKCGETARIMYSMLYHQMEDHILLQLYLEDDIEQCIDFMKGIFKNEQGEIVPLEVNFAEDYIKRVVTDMYSFREKLLILDAKLDDKVVELMKVYLAADLAKQDPNLKLRQFLFDCQPDGEHVFVMQREDGMWASMPFAVAMYNTIQTQFSDQLANDKEVVIDEAWAMKTAKAD